MPDTNLDALIVQGSNNPLVIEFEETLDFPAMVITLWNDALPHRGQPLKRWGLSDVTIVEDKVICPLSERETAAFPETGVILEVKGIDGNGYTVFWEQYPVKVEPRRDKQIRQVVT